MGNRAIKKTCTICGKNVRDLFRHKLDYCCRMCYRKKVHMIENHNFQSYISLESALKKVYTVKGYKRIKNGKPRIRISQIHPPSILIGHKVKLVLVD